MFHFTRIDKDGGADLSRGDIPTIPQISVNEASGYLDRSVCTKLQEVWVAALLRVRSSPEPGEDIELRMHGDTWHFNTFSDGPGYRGGSCWSPEQGSKMAELVKLGALLASYTRSSTAERDRIAGELDQRATTLLTRFNREAPLDAPSGGDGGGRAR